MFAKNSGRNKSRNKKRVRSDDVFDVQEFVAETFTNLNPAYARIWEKNIQSTAYIATLTTHLAAKIGITDRGVIQKFLRGFLLENRETAQLSCDHFRGSARDVMTKVDQFAKKLEFLKILYETIDQPEALLGLFLFEKRERIVVEMTNIVKNFDEVKFNYEFLHDWLAVYLFLRCKKNVEPYLDMLECALQRRAMPLARRNQFCIFKNGHYQLPESNENPYERYKILSGFLYPWARNNGFQQRAKYIGILQQGDFLSMIACKTIFKDSSTTADLDHGVWSHAIQWYCIFEHQKVKPFLQHEAMQVYQSFGSDEQIAVKSFLQTAWDKIIDRLDARHFTSPTEITAILSKRASLKRWPLLCESIMRQERKTHEKYGDYDHYGDYLEKKHADEHDHYKIVKKLKIR